MGDPISPWPGRMLDLGGRAVFARHAPPLRDGLPPAVFVHGLGGASTNWTDLMDLLRGHVDGLAPDLPGFGLSPPPPDGDYSVDGHAATIARLIKARGGPVHLLGNSLGGAVATRVAAEWPALVRTLTLISPALPDLRLRRGPARGLLAAAPGLGPALLAVVTRRPAETRVQAVLDMCYYDATRVHPQRLMEAVEEVRRRDGLGYAGEALVASLRGVVVEFLRAGSRALWRQARRVTAPCLVIYGSHDRMVDPRMASRASRVFPGSRVVILPQNGHVPQMESPDVVAGEFLALLGARLPQR